MKSILQHTWKVLLPKERKQFSLLILLDVLISFADILSLAALLWIIQQYIAPANSNTLKFLPVWMKDNNSLWPVGIFVILFAIKNAAGFLISKAMHRFISHVAIRISENNLRHYQLSPYEEFVHVDSSVHIRKIAFQPYEFCQYILVGIQQIITQFFLIAMAITAILLFNAKLFLLLLVILLPPALAIFYFSKKNSEKYKNKIQAANQSSFRFLLDALKGYVEGNIYGKNDFFLSRFVHQRNIFSRNLFASLSLQSLPSRFIEVFAVAGLFLLIVISKWYGSSASSLMLIGVFMAAAYKIIPSLVRMINAASQIKAYELSLAQLVQHPQEDSEINAERIRSVELNDVNFTYNGHSIIDKINLEINPGDFVGIAGKSGIGKSTLLNLIAGFLQPGAGEIIFNHEPVDAETIKKFWPYCSYVRQQPFFIHDSVLKNITLNDEECNDDKLKKAMEATGLNNLVSSGPHGLEKIITENGKNISGGQQQRIALARALYHEADLYLLDEPFSQLDECSEKILLQHFQQIAKSGKMVVMVTHHKEALKYCNKIISLDEE